jgi:HAD superfamily hydrolase (TIGR01484 family)
MSSSHERPAPLDAMTPEDVRGLRGVLFDLDDTFTTDGRIPACAFAALWDLRRAGLAAVPVTGRPAGWCDHIARMWPVDGVIGENGALAFWFDAGARKLRRRYRDPEGARAEKRQRLATVRDAILAAVPGSAVAADQAYRESDLAIDYCEDVPPLGPEAVEAICAVFREHGAACKVSSIHVNGWFGDYDKLGMAEAFLADRFGLAAGAVRERFAYCGDSPNDEPMFGAFCLSTGVRNVERFLDAMTTPPAYVTTQEGGEGFAELAARLLCLRA